MATHLLLNAFYLPPIAYFQTIQQHNLPILIEQYEHFQKQSYRTRAHIATANGIQDLILPIQHGNKKRLPLKDIKLSYEFDWQRLHWLSLQAAYRSSAYFEYYEDDFAHFYEKPTTYLLDFNIQQLELLLKAFKLKREITFTEEYFRAPQEQLNFRDRISPKLESLLLNPKPYYQVFEDRIGFKPDLSAVDLLFNQGPQSKNYL